MTFVRVIDAGDYIPKGYGVAWHVPDRDCTLCLPLGLNKLAGMLRRAWHWLMQGVRPSVVDRAYCDGVSAGSREVSDRIRAVHANYARRADDAIRRAEARLSRLATEGDLGVRFGEAILSHVRQAVREIVS